MSGKIKFKIRTGVVGVGSMGQNHARVYSEISNLVGVFDLDQGQAKKVSKRFGVKCFNTLSDLLKNVDAITIAVPTQYHNKVALQAISQGIDILVEKPLASNTTEATEIVKLAKERGVLLSVGHIERHNPVVRYAKKAIDDGKWGKLITMHSRRVSNYPSRINDVGVLFDLAVHDLDIVGYLSNFDILSVYASGSKSRSDREDNVNVVMKHESGLTSVCETNWLSPIKIRKVGITTSTCFIEMDYMRQEIKMYESKYVSVDNSNLFKTEIKINETNIDIAKSEPLLNQLSNFLTAIKEDKEPLVTGPEAVEVIKISEAALKSLNQNELVKF